ncbi:MAG: fimbrillin family protein [Prevotella sp.]|nr:fimbrillin family protein [Prevotella sp.]
MKKFNYIALVALYAGLTACTEEVSDGVKIKDNVIRFAATIDDNVGVTRGQDTSNVLSPIELCTTKGTTLYLYTFKEPRKTVTETRGIVTVESMLNDFGVSAYTYNTTKPLAEQYANMFYNAHCTKDVGGSDWTTTTPYYWPTTGDKLAFYAYWPYDATGATVRGGNSSETGPMKISYTVNTDITSQTDLLTAFTSNLSFAPLTPVPLKFTHPLTQINIELSDDIAPGTITNLQFEYIATDGVYTFGKGWMPGAISSIPFVVSPLNEKIFMIPQTFDPSQPIHGRMTMTWDDGEEQYTLHANLTDTWQPNTVMTYRISTSSINHIRVEDVTYPADWDGTAFPFKDFYDDNTTIGVYAVNASGKVVAANIPLAYDQTNSRWTMERANRSKLPYDGTYSYYAYYPYHASISGGHSEDDVVTVGTTAEDFFSGVLSNWTVSADQSTADKLLANDLHICKATTGSVHTQLRFPMKHAMGLAKITLGQTGTKEIVKLYKWQVPEPVSPTLLATIESQTTIYASDQFQSNMPIESGGVYYFITKGGTSTTFSSVTEASAPNAWDKSYSVTIGNGETSSFTVALARGDLEQVTYKGWRFDYTNGEQTFIVPANNNYRLEVFGAQGGYNGGKGGKSVGTKNLVAGSVLYVNVGGQGLGDGSHQYRAGGYNGGGNAISDGDGNTRQASGGGATHIATASGILSSLSGNKDAVLIVAGGGGGTGGNSALMFSAGGDGGGLEGLPGVRFDCGYYYDRGFGGTQNEGGKYYCNSSTLYTNGSFGQGASRVAAGAGGGWYGGGSGGYCAGGGSGYIGGVNDGITTAGLRTGHGEARIISLTPLSD